MKEYPKSQKDYYHNKIREFEKRTGINMNVKDVSKIYDCNIYDVVYNTSAAMDMMWKHGCYIYHDALVEEDPRSNGTNWLKYGFAHVIGKTYKYYYETNQWGQEVSDIQLESYKDRNWKAAKLDKSGFPHIDQENNYLPYTAKNKHIGSGFDEFLKTNNIELKRDMNWAFKMLSLGKIMTREGNRSLVLFPSQKSNNQDAKINVDDLFAEDWIVVQNKTFKEVLDDLYAGKTIRRISWDPSYGLGKFAQPYGVTYLDLLADDWESVDVVAEVNKNQQDIIDGKC